jgi:medium-chain acyl-[acyl-carrier-protein] hydrolase
MADPVPVYEKQYHVGLGDVDFQKKLKISALFNFFQDIASLHAEDLGVGIDRLMNGYGVTWVLTRIRVDINRMPHLGETSLLRHGPNYPRGWNLTGISRFVTPQTTYLPSQHPPGSFLISGQGN